MLINHNVNCVVGLDTWFTAAIRGSMWTFRELYLKLWRTLVGIIVRVTETMFVMDQLSLLSLSLGMFPMPLLLFLYQHTCFHLWILVLLSTDTMVVPLSFPTLPHFPFLALYFPISRPVLLHTNFLPSFTHLFSFKTCSDSCQACGSCAAWIFDAS